VRESGYIGLKCGQQTCGLLAQKPLDLISDESDIVVQLLTLARV